MKIVCYYNRNLKMSSEKLASQIGHVCKKVGWLQEATLIGALDDYDTIVVLGLRQNKFKEKLEEIKSTVNHNYISIQTDLGLTEVDAGTITAFGYIKDED